MGTIIHAINEIGYTVDFTVLNSKYFDVAQNRERVYLIAVRDDLITPEPWKDVKGTTMLPKAKRRYQEEGARTFNFDWPEQAEVRTRLRDFLEETVDAKYYLSEDKTVALVAQLEATNYVNDGRVEQFSQGEGVSCCLDASYAKGTAPGDVGKGRRTHVIEETGRIIEVGKIKPHRNSSLANSVHSTIGISSTLDTMQGGGREPKILEESPIMLGHIDLKGHDAIKRVYSPTWQGPTLTTIGGGHREPKIAEEVRPVLTPFREEKRQNGPRFKENDAEAHTITTQDRHGIALGEYPKYRIRKLTPRECLRLQSVPEDVIDALSTHFSDSRLYKFAGNGLTTNVITAIGERLLTYL